MTRRRDIISLIDKTSAGAPAGALDRIAHAISHQLRYHVAPSWRISPTTMVVGEVPGAHPMYLVDQLDVAGALGYHDDNPKPDSYIGVGVILANGGDWLTNDLSVASVCSHEAVELVGDPSCNRWADDGNGKLYAVELCDPVESTSYIVEGTTVSDFVLPSWFDPTPDDDRFSYAGSVSAPFQLGRGGYAIVASEGRVHQVFGDGPTPASRAARIGARTKARQR